jgi:TolA-binding protein
MNCHSKSSTSPDIATTNSESDSKVKKLKVNLLLLDEKIEKLENQITNLNTTIDNQSGTISTLEEKLTTSDDVETSVIDETMLKLQNKVKILEDRAFYTDSLYFEIVNDLVMIENKIVSLTTSYREMSDLKIKGHIQEIPPISKEEYKAKYIEALSQYQNGEWTKSLGSFSYLITVDRTNDLADNCQYWIGEVYYAMKDFRRSIKEFENVFSFPASNKADHAQYKLGLCYINISNEEKAKEEFKKLIDYYPNSEYYKKAKQYYNQYNN